MFEGKWSDDVVRDVVSAAVSGRDGAVHDGRVLMGLMLYRLELDTHRLLARTFPFRQSDVALYADRLIADHGPDALTPIRELLLREDLDISAWDVNYVLRAVTPLERPSVTAFAVGLMQSIDVPRLLKTRRWEQSIRTDHAEEVTDGVWRLVENIGGVLALAYRDTAQPVPPHFHACFLVMTGPVKPVGRLLGLDLFFGHLQPAQTYDFLLATLQAGNRVKYFGAAVREQGVAEAKNHAQSLYGRLNDRGREAMRESGWLLW